MPEVYLGLISGTSMDAVDAVALEFTDKGRPRLLASRDTPPDPALRESLLHLSQEVAGVSLPMLGELDQRVAELFAQAALELMESAGLSPADITAIGSHGQTLYHAPDAPYPFSLQIGDPNVIAARTGIPVVTHFRGADIAAGGQGAPMVPAFHAAMFHDRTEPRCLVNIGGIANITLLPAEGDDAEVIGFDTGPGNALLDAWTAEHLGEPKDTDGAWAQSGRLDESLLSRMLQDPYFQRPPPKSSGRDSFNLDWVRQRIASGHRPPDPATVQRTLCELTARTIAAAIESHGLGRERVLLCGGGAHNRFLRERLNALLAPRPLEDTGDYGLAVDWVEAAAFAWLAMRTIKGMPGNMPAVTGARESVVLGGVYDPRSQLKAKR